MNLNEAMERMLTCAPITGWCPRENECFLVAKTLQDYQKARDSYGALTQSLDQEDVLEIEFYVPEVGFFITKKHDFDFEF